ncbi:hypothetical protein F4604DRAFT_1685061 [Suillus subluteus]|nr:hypothetical protein F4604DRAFT_1685061 [Suillus subluteus]
MWPLETVLEAQVKRRSKAQKAADDLALKEAKEAKEALFKKRLERLTHIKTEMGKKQGEVLTKKAAPIRPKPRARKVTKTAVVEHGDHQGDSILDDLPEADEIDNHQRTPTEQMDDVPATTGKGKKVVVGKRGSTKTMMHDAISNMQKKHNKSSSNVEATILGGRVTNWVSAVKPGKLESSPHASSLSTREPPSTIFSHNTASSTANSATQPPSSIGAAQTKHVPDDTLTGAFGDEIDDSLEYEAICEEKQDKRKTKTSVTTSIANSQPPAPKKAKIKSAVCGIPAKLKPKCQQNVLVDTTLEHMKARGAYLYKDLILVLNGVVHSLNWAFLYEDPGSPSPLMAYRSPFILQLLGMAHLNIIKGYVEVPSFDMHELVMSGMSRVLALSAVAIERALGLIKNEQLKVQDVLLSTLCSKVAIKLPKVLNKLTGKETNVPFLFSASLWSKPTKAFIKSILSKPAGCVT